MTPERFEEAIIAFQSFIARNPSSIPDDLTLLDFINDDFLDGDEEEVTAVAFDALMTSADNEEAMSRLKKVREHYYLRQIKNEPKGQTGMIFALKQPKNGGYSDKQEVSQEKTLTIKFEGVGGADAYK